MWKLGHYNTIITTLEEILQIMLETSSTFERLPRNCKEKVG
jgi:hypothetical protein